MRWLAGISVVALLGLALPAGATPVCPDEPRTVCGGRIFPEAETSTAFVQHDSGEYESGIKALARDFPRFVKVKTFSQFLGEETLSAGGREIWLVEITDFDAPEEGKIPVAISLSVHGPERAGLEGGVRYMEDLARWATDEPDRLVMNGTEPDSVQMPVSELLKKVHLYVSNINPDGWADGDAQNGGVYTRGNGNGTDLNRQFPTIGWTKTTGRPMPMTEPEAIAWVKVMKRVQPRVTGDLHGETTSAQNAFADMMYPAGEWDVIEQAQQERAARHMASNVARYFQEDGVVASDATGVAGMKPAEYATGFDVVGYDDAGFMGDWFTQRLDALDMDVEHFLSHMVPNSTWSAPLEDAHIASVRGEIESLMVEATQLQKVRPTLALGKTAYVFDPWLIEDRYTRMKYFSALSRRASEPLTKLWSNQVMRMDLSRFDTVVVSGKPFPRTRTGKKPGPIRFAASLERFVRGGGNLVLTDRALRLLKKLDVAPRDAINERIYGAGHIDIESFDDPYLKDVHTTASQTYYEVPLGYTLDEDSSPHWVVTREAWEGAGGTTLAYIEDEAEVGLGRLELGKGTIGIIGALLPQPTAKYDHLYGLADYAVTVAGGQIFNNMIAFGR